MDEKIIDNLKKTLDHYERQLKEVEDRIKKWRNEFEKIVKVDKDLCKILKKRINGCKALILINEKEEDQNDYLLPIE